MWAKPSLLVVMFYWLARKKTLRWGVGQLRLAAACALTGFAIVDFQKLIQDTKDEGWKMEELPSRKEFGIPDAFHIFIFSIPSQAVSMLSLSEVTQPTHFPLCLSALWRHNEDWTGVARTRPMLFLVSKRQGKTPATSSQPNILFVVLTESW